MEEGVTWKQEGTKFLLNYSNFHFQIQILKF